MTEFALNRRQIEKLTELATHFREVEWFTLSTNSTGIGATVEVRFNLFGDADKDEDTRVNITDVTTW